jgi:hypothetical protein
VRSSNLRSPALTQFAPASFSQSVVKKESGPVRSRFTIQKNAGELFRRGRAAGVAAVLLALLAALMVAFLGFRGFFAGVGGCPSALLAGGLVGAAAAGLRERQATGQQRREYNCQNFLHEISFARKFKQGKYLIFNPFRGKWFSESVPIRYLNGFPGKGKSLPEFELMAPGRAKKKAAW